MPGFTWLCLSHADSSLAPSGVRASSRGYNAFALAMARHPKLAILVQGGGPVRQGTIPQHVYARRLAQAFKGSAKLVATEI